MPKKRRSIIPQQEEEQLGVAVQDIEGLTKSCRAIFWEALGTRSLGFTDPRRVAGNRVICNLTGTGATRAEAKYIYTVVPFLETRYGLYWLANSLEFKFHEGMYYLENVSLSIFKGEANDDKKIALIRAEWACSDEDARASHAQPHWHIYPSQINREIERYQNEFQVEPPVKIFVSDGEDSDTENAQLEWNRGERFHFAMAARWHIDGKDSSQTKYTDGQAFKLA